MRIVRLVAALVALATLAVPRMALAQPDPRFNADFAQADDDASRVMSVVRCINALSIQLQRGIAGPPEALGASPHCLLEAGSRTGAMLESSDDGAAIVRMVAVDLDRRVLRTTPLDTARLLAEARAARMTFIALMRQGPPDSVTNDYMHFVTRAPSDSIEVWLLPLSMFSADAPTAGGAVRHAFSPDGRFAGRVVGTLGTARPVTLEAGQAPVIESREERIPSVGELMAANILLQRTSAPVTIRTRMQSSTLAPGMGSGFWMHTSP